MMSFASLEAFVSRCLPPRFYRLDVQPDLFGGFSVVKEWGRIGARGRMMDKWHMTEAEALAALQRQADPPRHRQVLAKNYDRIARVERDVVP
jgi:WGR domain